MTTSELEHLIERKFSDHNAKREHWKQYALSSNTRGDSFVDILSLFTDVAGKCLLDVGMMCAGVSIAALKRGAGTVVGIDVDEGYFEYARANARDHSIGDLPLLRADIQTCPFRESAFDIIVCTDVIEHVPRPEALAGEIARVLRPGVVLLLSAPNKYGIRQLVRDDHYHMPLVAAMPRWLSRPYLLTFSKLRPEEIDFQLARPQSYWSIKKLFASVSIRLELTTIRRMQSKAAFPNRILGPDWRRLLIRGLNKLGLTSLAIRLYHSPLSASFFLSHWMFVGVRE